MACQVWVCVLFIKWDLYKNNLMIIITIHKWCVYLAMYSDVCRVYMCSWLSVSPSVGCQSDESDTLYSNC